MTSDGLKPKDQWDVDDWLDHLDGWHEASGLHYKSDRDPNREVLIFGELNRDTGKRPIIGRHPAGALLAGGRATRERHRGEHGV